jgi:hypothetical protein
MAPLFSIRFLATATTSALLACMTGCASRASVADSTASATNTSRADRREHASPERPADLLAEPPNESIIAIHRSKCGACHTRVEPGSITRATAESAMQRHRRRAKLTEREWEDMVDYLSADGLAHARPTARVP